MSNCAAAIAAGLLGIEIPDQFGRRRRLSDYRGQIVVVYFYPKDDTPGCTLEGKEFRDLHEKFPRWIASSSASAPIRRAAHRAFADNHGFPFILLADERGELARDFGVLHDDRAERATFVLDRNGRVAKDFLDVTPRGHAQRVLKFAQALVESHLMIGG